MTDSFANWHTAKFRDFFCVLIICLCQLAAVTDRLVLPYLKNNNNKPQKITIDIYSTAVSSTHFDLKDVGLCWLFLKILSMPNNKKKKKVSPAKWLSVRNPRERERVWLFKVPWNNYGKWGEKMSVYTQGGSRVTLDKTHNVAQGPSISLEIK